MNDLKYAFRTLVKSPAFTLVAILTLALGIGASTAIFSVLDAVLLRPLPYPNQERIVELRETAADGHGMSFAEPNFHDLVARARSFEAISAYTAGPETVAGGSEPVRTNICAVSADFFRVLGIQPILGRAFAPDLVRENKEIAIVSFGFWKRLLGERASLEGTTLHIDNRTFSVIGVMPAETEFPPNIEVWFPVDVYPANVSRTAHNWRVAARLKPAVSAAQARDEMSAIGRQLKAENGQRIDLVSIGLTPLRERFVKDIRSVLVVIAAAVGFLFLIAGSNVANLLLVRATGRRHEIAVRAALGASRWRLARQFLVETMLLTLIGGALGIVLAFWGIDLILGAYHGNLPRVGRIGISITALIFTVGISLFAGIVLGFVPAFSSSRRELQDDLQSAGRGKSTGRHALRFRNSLVVAQLALTLMLLIGAGLLGRSFARLLEVNPGFEPESAVAMTVSLPYAPEPAALRGIAQFHHQLMERLLSFPGVTAVGGVSALPMTRMGANGTFIIEDGPNTAETMSALSERLTALANTGKTGDADYRCASAGYFAALGIPLVRGRTFLESDGPDSPHAAVINETMARRYWPNDNPIGKQLQYGNMDGDLRLLHIVGVVGDVRGDGLEAEPRPTVYTNYFQRPAAASEFSIVTRGQVDVASLIAAMRRETRALDPQLPMKFQTVREIVSASLDNRRFSMLMLGVFAGAALLLAMIGLYGVMAYITSQRTHEIGIRMALGAQRVDMLRMIFRQSFTLVLSGIAVGILASIALTRLLGTMLYGVQATDVVTYGSVIGLLIAAAALASYIPARRAMKVDPMVALRYE